MAKGIVKISDILDVKDPLQKYWLYFMPGHSKVQNWFCKGFGHITILKREEKKWFLIDPQPHRLKIDILPFKGDLPKQLTTLLKGKKCVHLSIDNKEIKKVKYRWWYFLLPQFVSCVSIVRYILGIELKGATPLGVIKYLKKIEKECPLKNGLRAIKFIKE